MRPRLSWLLAICALILTAAYPAQLAPAAASPAGSHDAWWIFFTDKDASPPSATQALALATARAALTPRALARRAKTRGDAPVDLLDLPDRKSVV